MLKQDLQEAKDSERRAKIKLLEITSKAIYTVTELHADTNRQRGGGKKHGFTV